QSDGILGSVNSGYLYINTTGGGNISGTDDGIDARTNSASIQIFTNSNISGNTTAFGGAGTGPTQVDAAFLAPGVLAANGANGIDAMSNSGTIYIDAYGHKNLSAARDGIFAQTDNGGSIYLGNSYNIDAIFGSATNAGIETINTTGYTYISTYGGSMSALGAAQY